MNDPLSSLHAPPPRYLLESDSSDEEGQGAYPETSRRPPRPTASLNPSIELNLNFSEVKCAVVGVGQAGLYLIRKAGAHRAVGDITTERGLVGRLYAMDEGVMVFMEEGESNEGISEVAVTLMNSLKARSWVIVSTYLSSLYIPDLATSSSSPSGPPIRHLQISGRSSSSLPGVEAFTSPNYVTGLPAALASIIAHPVSRVPHETPVDLLLLPLPLSSLLTSSLATSLSTLTPKLSQAISKPSAIRWEEDDDDPFSSPGMGDVRRRTGKENRALKEESLGMYL